MGLYSSPHFSMSSPNDASPQTQKPPPRDPDKEFDWEKAYQCADGLLRLEELCFDQWKEEQRWERKFKEFPNGLHVEGNYHCIICGHHEYEKGEHWRDSHGTTCLPCHDAIERGELPATVASDEDSWYSTSDIEHAFAVKAKVIRRWVKAGSLKARTILRKEGERIPFQLFLIEENKDILPPKSLVKNKFVKERNKEGQWAFRHDPWFRYVNPAEHLKGYKILDLMRELKEDDMDMHYPQMSSVPAIPYLFTADPL